MHTDHNYDIDSLFAKARRLDASPSPDPHFETRLMATIQERQHRDGVFTAWVWRMVPVFSLCALLMVGTAAATKPDDDNSLYSLAASTHENVYVHMMAGE